MSTAENQLSKEAKVELALKELLEKGDHIEVDRDEVMDATVVRLWRIVGGNKIALQFLMSDFDLDGLPFFVVKDRLEFILTRYKWRKNDKG